MCFNKNEDHPQGNHISNTEQLPVIFTYLCGWIRFCLIIKLQKQKKMTEQILSKPEQTNSCKSFPIKELL